MSPEYNNVVSQLTEHFKRLMVADDFSWKVRVTRAEYARGVDCLGEPFTSIVKEASRFWLREHNYEVSYTQICRAFFMAADGLGKLEIY